MHKVRARTQCPETVRKSSTHRTTSGRCPDIEVRNSSASRLSTGRLPDLVYEVTQFVNRMAVNSQQ